MVQWESLAVPCRTQKHAHFWAVVGVIFLLTLLGLMQHVVNQQLIVKMLALDIPQDCREGTPVLGC